jgi:transcriptional regulator with XRE-family HTH domain
MKKNRDGNFGRFLRERRRDLGISQRELAARLRIDFTYISKLENGHEDPPSSDTLRRLAVELGVSEVHMLAKAGKVPVELRTRASEDPEFAFLVQQLPSIPQDSLRRMLKAAGLRMPDLSNGAK